jgi:hypothetical protein
MFLHVHFLGFITYIRNISVVQKYGAYQMTSFILLSTYLSFDTEKYHHISQKTRSLIKE